jgi:sugar (pentulose or hexulose) kinase
MSQRDAIAIGLDLGTSGARAVAMSLEGRLIAEGRAALPRAVTVVDGGRVEQDPTAWTTAADGALRALASVLPAGCTIAGLAVDATSGTFLLADADLRPLTPGIMYNDLRATGESDEAAAALREVLAPYGISIAPAFALPKLVHLARQQPHVFARCRHVVHQTDWLVGSLCGRYDVTDISTALKTGADPGSLTWPAAVERLGIPREVLPTIVLPGTKIGTLTAAGAARTGLPAGLPVVAGCTDGTAGCLASGAAQVGDVNVTLGTTLIFKAIAAAPLLDPSGEIYNHRHPAGGYLPGAASSTGGDWIGQQFGEADLTALDREAAGLLPTGETVYPLVKCGERFPFACASAVGFGLAEIRGAPRRFAAGMEGVAFLERLGIARLEELGLPAGPTVYATGGGAASDTWLRIRASVNRRVYAVPEHAECAVGAAVLAALPHCGSYADAAAAIVRAGRRIAPDPRLADAYDEGFARFRQALQQRGYL